MNIETVRDYCLSKPHVTEDTPFGPDYIVYRTGGNIFCCLALAIGNIVQLKWNPNEFDEVVDKYPSVGQAWHWHKRHMIQFDLDETTMPDADAEKLIDRAYEYVWNRLPKKTRAQLNQ